MFQHSRLVALTLCFALSSVSLALQTPQGLPSLDTLPGSSSLTATETTESAENIPSDIDNGANSIPVPQQSQTETTPKAAEFTYTSWTFQIDVTGFQHEPAGKSLDRFDAKLTFGAGFNHAYVSTRSRGFGYGEMRTSMLSRAPHSFQAPHRAAKKFKVRANSFWGRKSKMVSVVVHPQDAVTYSLTTGEVLGTVGVLKLMLADAKCDGLHGTLLAFTIPENTRIGSEFHCKFDTSNKHTCWYEGKATLKVLNKIVGKGSAIPSIGVTEAGGPTENNPKKKEEGEQVEKDNSPSNDVTPAEQEEGPVEAEKKTEKRGPTRTPLSFLSANVETWSDTSRL